jgi:transmembrane sensor
MSGRSQRQIQTECREWLTLLHSGEATDDDRARFDVWMQADPRHRHAYELMQLVWTDISSLRHLAPLKPVPARMPQPEPVHTDTGVLPWTVAAAVAGFAIFALHSRMQPSPEPTLATATAFTQDFATQLGEVRAIQLPDGSSLTLGAYSQAAVKLSVNERRVTLERGEAYFEVAKDAARPFFVDAQSATVRVVGTRFDVRLGTSHVRIAVDEGAVAVNHRSASVNGGQRIDVLANGTLTEPTRIEEGQVAGWREGHLVYEGAPLSEVVADLSRYRAAVILKSPAAGELRVTAGLRVEQIDQFVDRLPDILPVRVTRTAEAITIDTT